MLAPSRAVAAATLLLIAAPSIAIAPRPASPDPVPAAERLLLRGHADDTVNALRPVLAADPHNGPAHLLLCRTFVDEALPDDAIPECEAAIAAMPSSSPAQDWMGRAYGIKADQSGPIAGLRIASKVVAAFEAAVSLNPRNGDAVNDLSEFYVGAPSVVGGGLDKARDLADRSAAALPQNAHRIRAFAAQKDDDYGTAEREFRAAVGVAGRPNAWVDLGHFYALRKQYDQSLDALQHGLVATGRRPDDNFVDAAEVLIACKRHQDLAEQWLRAYLNGNAQNDAAPAFKAEVDLAKVLDRRNDKSDARTELNKALALASRYEPAQKALHSL